MQVTLEMKVLQGTEILQRCYLDQLFLHPYHCCPRHCSAPPHCHHPLLWQGCCPRRCSQWLLSCQHFCNNNHGNFYSTYPAARSAEQHKHHRQQRHRLFSVICTWLQVKCNAFPEVEHTHVINQIPQITVTVFFSLWITKAMDSNLIAYKIFAPQ